jgi:hypothetical protein
MTVIKNTTLSIWTNGFGRTSVIGVFFLILKEIILLVILIDR